MTPDSSLFVNQLRLEFSFLVSSSLLPWVLAQPHLRASPNNHFSSHLLASAPLSFSMEASSILHGFSMASLLLKMDSSCGIYSLGWASLTSRDKFIFLVVFLWISVLFITSFDCLVVFLLFTSLVIWFLSLFLWNHSAIMPKNSTMVNLCAFYIFIWVLFILYFIYLCHFNFLIHMFCLE